MATMASKDASISAERLPMPSRNPLPLSATQEAQVRDIYYTRVRNHCAPEIKGRRAGRVVRNATCSTKERERKSLKKTAQEDFIREWWGMPERDEESRRKLAEKLALEERTNEL
ncbi:unnamed protein product [Parascedosporium putredinis]|uniref:Uncharacterized protein n=1 Tax=Parascedosporium putredinis TaxID=1442378 RepID=A0A9P1H9Y5_9PEZI|nr:unnamed protein product [Parascedosporium putredinis]CAI8002136.1 unnamed protein product [Parascedosporium putredinis]